MATEQYETQVAFYPRYNYGATSMMRRPLVDQMKEIIDDLSLLAIKTGPKVEVISGVSEHGSMVINLGNIGAILRYNPNYTS